MQRFNARNTVLFQERVDQQYRPEGNKDIFPKEDRDVVARGGMGFDFVADVRRQLADSFSAAPSAIGASSGRTVWA